MHFSSRTMKVFMLYGNRFIFTKRFSKDVFWPLYVNWRHLSCILLYFLCNYYRSKSKDNNCFVSRGTFSLKIIFCGYSRTMSFLIRYFNSALLFFINVIYMSIKSYFIIKFCTTKFSTPNSIYVFINVELLKVWRTPQDSLNLFV